MSKTGQPRIAVESRNLGIQAKQKIVKSSFKSNIIATITATAKTNEAYHIDVDRRHSGDSGFGDELTDVGMSPASGLDKKSRKNLLTRGVPAPKAAFGGLTGSPVKAPVVNPNNAQFQRNKPSISSSFLLIDLIHLSQSHTKNCLLLLFY